MKKGIFFFLLLIGSSMPNQNVGAKNSEKVYFAGGCFWCMEPPFEKLEGVKNVTAGYMGGTGTNPTYQDYGKKGFVEAIEVLYDSSQVSYETLLNTFWRQIDPTDDKGQFVDRGRQYRSAIFYTNEEQKNLAEKSKKALEKSKRFDKPIVTEIIKVTPFYPAEEYHQDYKKKNPVRYWWYRRGSGRDNFLMEAWSRNVNQSPGNKSEFKKLTTSELRKKLTPLQYKVTQLNGTEPPFDNIYWDNKKPGIYVDIVSGESLFSSLNKYKSGTGWPSFTKTLEEENVIERMKTGWFGKTIEVRSKEGNSHLGDLFYDGPKPAGRRYCINSAALRFIPIEDLEKEGYGKYLKLFQTKVSKRDL